jgi:hypothetical protein
VLTTFGSTPNGNKVQTFLVDDIDGSDADSTVSFRIDVDDYEIELSAADAAALRNFSSRTWRQAARRTPEAQYSTKESIADARRP